MAGRRAARRTALFLLYRLDTPELADAMHGRSSADARTQELSLVVAQATEQLEELALAYGQAQRGQVPGLAPCEVYCHSLTDPSILGPGLREAGAQTLTCFGLHMPARLFSREPATAKAQAIESTLRSLNSVLAEPIEDCLWIAPSGEPCLEARTPLELESELALPGGNIFHRDLLWPFAEDEAEVGTWGVETAHPNVFVCGAGARRGGGVSGIPGHNAARAVLSRSG